MDTSTCDNEWSKRHTYVCPLVIWYILQFMPLHICSLYIILAPKLYQLHWALLYGQYSTTHCIWTECWELIVVCSVCCLSFFFSFFFHLVLFYSSFLQLEPTASGLEGSCLNHSELSCGSWQLLFRKHL